MENKEVEIVKPRRKNPVPNSTPFTSEYQPSPESKSRGQQKRNARIRLQALMELTLDEMLEKKTVRELDVLAVKKFFDGGSTIADIFFDRVLRAVGDTNVKPEVGKAMFEALIKVSYGDKIEHSGEVTQNVNIANDVQSILNNAKMARNGKTAQV